MWSSLVTAAKQDRLFRLFCFFDETYQWLPGPYMKKSALLEKDGSARLLDIILGKIHYIVFLCIATSSSHFPALGPFTASRPS